MVYQGYARVGKRVSLVPVQTLAYTPLAREHRMPNGPRTRWGARGCERARESKQHAQEKYTEGSPGIDACREWSAGDSDSGVVKLHSVKQELVRG